MSTPELLALADELDYWSRVIGDRVGSSERRFNETARLAAKALRSPVPSPEGGQPVHAQQRPVPDLRPPSPDFRVTPVRVLQSAYDRIDAILAGMETDLRAANSVRIELRHLINETYAVSSTVLCTPPEPQKTIRELYPTARCNECEWEGPRDQMMSGVSPIDELCPRCSSEDTEWSLAVSPPTRATPGDQP